MKGRGAVSRVAQKGNGIVLFLHVPSAKQRNRENKKKPRFYLFITRERKRSRIPLDAPQRAEFLFAGNFIVRLERLSLRLTGVWWAERKIFMTL